MTGSATVPYELRPLRPDDPYELAAVLALNNDAVPAVNALDEARLRALVGLAVHAEVVVDTATGGLAGFVIVLPAGTAYESVLYGWFAQRYERFLYLDRIVVAPAFRRRGAGWFVYDGVEELARAEGRLLCEVNLDPPNPDSQAFHAARGYVEVGRYAILGGGSGDKLCRMLAKELG